MSFITKLAILIIIMNAISAFGSYLLRSLARLPCNHQRTNFQNQNVMATCALPVMFKSLSVVEDPNSYQPVLSCRSSGTLSSRLRLSQAVNCGVRLSKTFGIGKAFLNLRTCT